MPTKVIYGKNFRFKISEYGKEYGMKGLLVVDQSILNTNLVKTTLIKLDENNINYIIWSDLVPNPRDVDIEKGAAFAVENGIDYVIAIGGGSTLDTAKAIAAIMTNGGKCKDLYGRTNMKKKIAPVIAVPTTCGTGSEVTHESIVNDTSELVKKCIGSELNSPSLAILDPVVLEGLPSSVLAATGMDALTHAIEAYVCKRSNPLTDAMAILAIKMISESLLDAVENGKEDSFEKMLVASCMAGLAFGNSDVASVHSVSEALGGFYDIPHGVANAIMLPIVSRHSVKGAVKRYAEVASAMGIDSSEKDIEKLADEGIEYMEYLKKKLNIPRFSDYDSVNPKDFSRLAHTAANAPETKDNPILMDAKAFEEILYEAYNE